MKKKDNKEKPNKEEAPDVSLYSAVLNKERRPYQRYLKLFTLFGADSAYLYCRALDGALTSDDISDASYSTESGSIIQTVRFYQDKSDLAGLSLAIVRAAEMEMV